MKEEFSINNLRVKHKVISVSRLQELQSDIDKTEQDGNLSKLKEYRSYIKDFKFQVSETFPEAKYVVVLAIEHNLAKVNFLLNGQKKEVFIPHDYHKLNASVKELGDFVEREIIKETGYKVEHNRVMYLKLLAVRSGLGKYGRNNICYVDGLGSFLSLYTFFTDFDFQVDNWHDLSMMDCCEGCMICVDNCPTNTIPEEDDDEFIINVESCITLHNETPGEFPDWLSPDVHNSLMGCRRCQQYCPANSEAIKRIICLEDITEEETKMILEGKNFKDLTRSISQKLRILKDSSVEFNLPTIKRNLEMLLKFD